MPQDNTTAHTTFLNSLQPISKFTNDLINSGVYCIYCSDSDRFYIGESGIIIKRITDHLSKLRSGSHPTPKMQQDFNVYGEDSFKFGVIHNMPDSTYAKRVNEERKELQRYNRYGRKLYNVMLGGKMYTSNYAPSRNPGPKTSTTTSKKKDETEEHIPNKPYKPPMRSRDMSTPINGTCRDCGASGTMYIHIFVCDDNKKRCSGCIDRHLADWRMNIKQVKASTKDYKAGACFRWLIDNKKHIKEVLASATTRYIEKHGHEPSSILVNETYEGPAKFEGIEISVRRTTPNGYLDFPI